MVAEKDKGVPAGNRDVEPNAAVPAHASAESRTVNVVEESPTDDLAGADESTEIQRLRAENAALKQQVNASSGAPAGSSRRMRNAGAIVLVIIAAILISLAIPAIWVNRMITSTDYYVATVSPLAEDQAIQDAVAAAASDAAIEQLDLTARLKARLPEDLAFLAAPISNAADDFIRKQATTFVRSDGFPRLWNQANQIGHKAFVAAVTGRQDGAVQVAAGTITLDVGVLVDTLLERLAASGFDLVKNVPTGSIDRTITLYQSDTLAQASVIVDGVQRIALALPLLGLALLAGAVALAADRRRTLLWSGWSLLLLTLLPLQAIYIGQSYIGGQLLSLTSIPAAAAQNAYAIIFADLIRAEQLFVGISLLLIVGTLLAGPSRWATALRTGVSGGLSGVSSHLDLGVFGEWVARRMAALRVVGYLLAAAMLVFLPRPRTIEQVLWIAGFVLMWVLAVQLAGSGSASPQDTANFDRV